MMTSACAPRCSDIKPAAKSFEAGPLVEDVVLHLRPGVVEDGLHLDLAPSMPSETARIPDVELTCSSFS
jgi:hypothetical protein